MIHLESMLEKGITAMPITMPHVIMRSIITPVVRAPTRVVGLINPTMTTTKKSIKA
jgi:hypothetical protein